MEITIDRKTLSTTLILVGLLALLGLAALGRSYTVTTKAGSAEVLSWEDWQLAKAQKHFGSERNILRADADSLAILLDRAPDPVAAQLLAGRIGQHTSAGVSVLLPARTALLQAAQDVVSWSAGALDRDTAVASLQAAVVLLK
jgi:hypothetical protein